ncbi:hypothetical protein ASPWEDRAFT_45617 [Aspergillus wentii DTO 134E9]|uniref:Nitroreductase domain-containing protein n=1 Tax=Aspergillus wentii DTO 134E9 TaxID=1073089 RepID=A0A1L9R9T3_ASPWE|nr:uncharacterized protein ASPWEDRAFT_45617 [Aspergillus wentii DTO 134E9]OJJ31648.1 hypothetical protein ASPWEDRAFT_45617 [Aspergillus wentii DTO 134E9]
MADNMNSLKFRDRIHQRRREGQPLTEDEIMFITNESAELAGAGSNGMPQRRIEYILIVAVSPEHIRWASKAKEVLKKPANEINKGDARDVTSKEVSLFPAG